MNRFFAFEEDKIGLAWKAIIPAVLGGLGALIAIVSNSQSSELNDSLRCAIPVLASLPGIVAGAYACYSYEAHGIAEREHGKQLAIGEKINPADYPEIYG